jgi:hypothetical protein
MKSAYDLAMERLAKHEPVIHLTDDQKQQLAELDSLYHSKIAERETFLKSKIAAAKTTGHFEEVQQIQDELARDLRSLQDEWKTKKDKLRKSFC